MEQREFLKTIKTCRRRLNMAEFLKILLFALCVGAGVGILFQAAAFVAPLYYANFYTLLALLIALPTAGIAVFVKRVDMKQTALVMDSFGFDERIVTAYENLSDDKNFSDDSQVRSMDLVALQREDAMRQLKAHGDKIRIPLLPSWKSTAVLLGLVIILTGLIFVPSKTKDYAKELHSVKEDIHKKEDEIEEIIEALEGLAQEELSPEQQASLQEMIDSLQSSLSEYHQATSEEMAAAASEKLNYKYENINSQLSAMAQSLQNGATASAATTESMEAMAKKMQEMSGQQLAKGDGTGTGQGQGGQGSDGSQGDGQNGDGGQGDGTGQNGDGGQSGGQNGQNGNSRQGDSTGQNGNGGQGGDGESGNGRGTGSSSTPHDYVSIPNEIADSGNLTGNAVNHDASEYFYAQNGLSWEGTHMSHEMVIGSYEQNAYEGIAAGKYPSGMEDIIKEYFSSFN